VRLGIPLGLALLVTGALVYLGMQNTAPIPLVDLLFVQFSAVPVWALVASSVGLGVAITTLMFTVPLFRLRLERRRKNKRVAELEQEIHGLRTLPLTADEGGTKAEAAES
jgi:uncharacterized membrane protein YciS (DUF1049 family)